MTVDPDVAIDTILNNSVTVFPQQVEELDGNNNTATASTRVIAAAVVPVPPRARARVQQLTYA